MDVPHNHQFYNYDLDLKYHDYLCLYRCSKSTKFNYLDDFMNYK